ncbi:MAG: 50S ribosomal protein L6 [Verrucomicrobia bacterium]|nr:MAG: 50S ribosomal protein L6 [Verrucomicrobiota bacterium]
MSRLGKKPVLLPAGVTANVQGAKVSIKGPKGEVALAVKPPITVTAEQGQLLVARADDGKVAKSMHGTIRSLLAGMVVGVTQGYAKDLEIQGVGFRAALQGKKLTMSLGFSHPIEFEVPEGITVKVAENTQINVSGVNKQQVGEVAAHLRSFYPAEPYKGKGVRYKGEHVRRKAGKTVA